MKLSVVLVLSLLGLVAAHSRVCDLLGYSCKDVGYSSLYDGCCLTPMQPPCLYSYCYPQPELCCPEPEPPCCPEPEPPCCPEPEPCCPETEYDCYGRTSCFDDGHSLFHGSRHSYPRYGLRLKRSEDADKKYFLCIGDYCTKSTYF